MRWSLFVLLMVVLAVTLCEGRKKRRCRYSSGPWGACQNGRKTKELTLRPGSSKRCSTKKTVSIPCSTNTPATPAVTPKCDYTEGAWGRCRKGRRKRKLTLKAGSDASCRAVRYEKEHCGSSAPTKCVYRNSRWRRCKNGYRKKKMRLIRWKSRANCPRYRIVKKSCQRKG